MQRSVARVVGLMAIVLASCAGRQVAPATPPSDSSTPSTPTTGASTTSPRPTTPVERQSLGRVGERVDGPGGWARVESYRFDPCAADERPAKPGKTYLLIAVTISNVSSEDTIRYGGLDVVLRHHGSRHGIGPVWAFPPDCAGDGGGEPLGPGVTVTTTYVFDVEPTITGISITFNDPALRATIALGE